MRNEILKEDLKHNINKVNNMRERVYIAHNISIQNEAISQYEKFLDMKDNYFHEHIKGIKIDKFFLNENVPHRDISSVTNTPTRHNENHDAIDQTNISSCASTSTILIILSQLLIYPYSSTTFLSQQLFHIEFLLLSFIHSARFATFPYSFPLQHHLTDFYSPSPSYFYMLIIGVPGVRTLSIGDGANDVAMIQEAHVGVGIRGEEGLQAVNASDFAIAQFRFLSVLLLKHGRFNYVRMCRVVRYMFYKNVRYLFISSFYAYTIL